MSAVRPYWALARREVWEHKALWVVPIIIACLVVIGSLVSGAGLIVAAHHGDVTIVTVNQAGGGNARGGLHLAMLAIAGFFNVVMLFIVWFYLMDSLYADRKDRSILFWRSMPLSDTSTVLSKLFTGMVTAPAFTFALIVIAEIIAGIIFIIAAGIVGVNLLQVAFYPGTIILTWIVLAFALIQQSLWLVPYWGWFLLCSAWSRKYSLVLAWAILIPGGAMLLELITFRTHYLADGILGHIGRGLELYGSFAKHGPRMGFHGRVFGAPDNAVVTFGSVAHMFTLPEMWIGIGIGIVFILGAIWLRRNRSEI